MMKRDEYIAKLKLQLDELDARMETIEAKAKGAREDAREKFQQEMARLRDQSKLAKSKMAELKAAGEDKWEALVAETEKVRDAFVDAFKYFKSRL